jgi:hypothetical protein
LLNIVLRRPPHAGPRQVGVALFVTHPRTLGDAVSRKFLIPSNFSRSNMLQSSVFK